VGDCQSNANLSPLWAEKAVAEQAFGAPLSFKRRGFGARAVMDWDKIERDIHQASSATFAELIGQTAGGKIYAFCLYTDSDGGSVVPSANSEAGYRDALEAAGECTDLDRRYYRWAPEEWKYCGFGGNRFNAISRTLFASADLDHTAKAMVRALDRLRGDEAYTRLAEPPILFISASDDDRARSLENQSAQTLNSPERASIFLGR
jgi:hypothetical protein